MDPFERHEIRHLSPSSLALYRAAPALWVLRYLFGVRDDETPFAWRGKAVEAAVDAILINGASDGAAIELATGAFEAAAQGELAPEVNRERNAIPGMVRQAALAFRRLGTPVARQRRIELWLDGIEIPILGYADYTFPEYVLDLKTTFAIPSRPRPDHEVQIVTYADALSRRPGLVYISPRRVARYPHNTIDINSARRILHLSARALRAMLAAAESKEAAAALFVPTDDFRWSNATRCAAEAVWS
jgi:hypothetical protein